MKHRTLAFGLSAFIVIVAAIQFIKPKRTNPPVEPKMAFESKTSLSPETVKILRRSCTDCHSNSTRWPWYSHIAPVSWMVANDVQNGRRHLNLSKWGQLNKEQAQAKQKDICDEVLAGEMPLWIYTLMHKDARLSSLDKDTLCNRK
jgi:hypothetical protein